jgi:hypothetical protein
MTWWHYILLHVWATIDKVWIGNQMYWTLKHTICDYTLQITITYRLVLSATVFTALLGSSFQQRTFPFLLQLSTACRLHLNTLVIRVRHCVPFSSSPTTRRAIVEVFDPASIQDHTCNGKWSMLYSLGTDHTENTASNGSSIVTFVSVAAVKWWLVSHCLATGIFREPFPGQRLSLLASQFWLSADMPQYYIYHKC